MVKNGIFICRHFFMMQCAFWPLLSQSLVAHRIVKRDTGGGAGKARFNVATPTYEARTRPLHVQHTYYRIIFKLNPFNIISRGVQGCTSTDFRLK